MNVTCGCLWFEKELQSIVVVGGMKYRYMLWWLLVGSKVVKLHQWQNFGWKKK